LICVNDALRIAYIPIPKVASSAIRGVVQGRHAEEVPEGYFCFTFIRHPWDRLVSALYSNLRSFAPLDERLAQFVHQPGGRMDSHVRPQAMFLNGHRVDFIGRYDRLERDWTHIPLPFPSRENVGKHRPKDWREVPINWQRWLPIYERDFLLCPDWL
jgi:hypothetical protein